MCMFGQRSSILANYGITFLFYDGSILFYQSIRSPWLELYPQTVNWFDKMCGEQLGYFKT